MDYMDLLEALLDDHSSDELRVDFEKALAKAEEIYDQRKEDDLQAARENIVYALYNYLHYLGVAGAPSSEEVSEEDHDFMMGFLLAFEKEMKPALEYQVKLKKLCEEKDIDDILDTFIRDLMND